MITERCAAMGWHQSKIAREALLEAIERIHCELLQVDKLKPEDATRLGVILRVIRLTLLRAQVAFGHALNTSSVQGVIFVKSVDDERQSHIKQVCNTEKATYRYPAS